MTRTGPVLGLPQSVISFHTGPAITPSNFTDIKLPLLTTFLPYHLHTTKVGPCRQDNSSDASDWQHTADRAFATRKAALLGKSLFRESITQPSLNGVPEGFFGIQNPSHSTLEPPLPVILYCQVIASASPRSHCGAARGGVIGPGAGLIPSSFARQQKWLH